MMTNTAALSARGAAPAWPRRLLARLWASRAFWHTVETLAELDEALLDDIALPPATREAVMRQRAAERAAAAVRRCNLAW